MIFLVGLLFLIVAVIVAVAGVMTNSGTGHPVGAFTVFGQSVTGLSTGQLFLYGVVVGVVGMLGLSILTGAFTRRLASSGARRELRDSRRETTSARADSDRLTRQLDDEHVARAEAETSTPASPQPTTLPKPSPPLPARPGPTIPAPIPAPVPAPVPVPVPAPAERRSVRQRMFHNTGR